MDRSSLAIPGAIVISAILIAGAIYVTNAKPGTNALNLANNAAEQGPQPIEPVTASDHIRGNPNAPIVFVEYSDLDCPFCNSYHQTMQRLMQEYGAEGKIAWIYRHYPLTQLHPNAFILAEAAECVSAQGGNEAFWKFVDQVFGDKSTNEFTNLDDLSTYAIKAGVDATKFEQCRANHTYQDLVKSQAEDAVASGGSGTPHTIVIAGGTETEISGAQPYATVKGIIDDLLRQLDAN